MGNGQVRGDSFNARRSRKWLVGGVVVASAMLGAAVGEGIAAPMFGDVAACTGGGTPPSSSLGGPVLIATQIQVVFWDAPVDPRIVSFYSALVGNQNTYYDWVTFLYTHDPDHDGYYRYGSATGISITPSSTDYTGYVTTYGKEYLDDRLFSEEIAHQIENGVLPAPGIDAATGYPNTLYMIQLPPQVGFVDPGGGLSCSQVLGYHYNKTQTVFGSPTTIIYGVIPDYSQTDSWGPDCGTAAVEGTSITRFQNMTATISHEVFEAITDPLLDNLAWGGVQEIGDTCNQACLQAGAFDDLLGSVDPGTGAPFKVQLLWANNQQDCAGAFPWWWD